MKGIQKIKNQFKKLLGGATSRVVEKENICDGIASAALQGTGSCPPVVTGATPLARSVVTSAAPLDSSTRDSYNVSSINLNNHVLRHGLFLSLYSLIKKAIGKLPWRSRTNNNSGFSSSSSNYSLRGTRNYIKNFRRIRILGSASLFSLGLLLLATFVPLYNVTRTEDTEAAAG
ncbi:hypothetical protein IJJ39_01210, partial [Candidatus Saccharibacteria bacterium]|nr:hypothetical protein [Candidatus Saccharibacteria bacterium]